MDTIERQPRTRPRGPSDLPPPTLGDPELDNALRAVELYARRCDTAARSVETCARDLREALVSLRLKLAAREEGRA